MRDIAEIVGKVFEGCELSFGDVGADNRSYRVSFDKIHERLPEFSCDWNAERGAQQLFDVFRRIDMEERRVRLLARSPGRSSCSTCCVRSRSTIGSSGPRSSR